MSRTIKAVLMSRAEAQRCVDRIKSHLDSAREELLRLYDGEGWRALGYASWRACVTAEFGQSQTELYRQLQAARIERVVSPNGKPGEIPASHLLPLSDLPKASQATVWERVQVTPGKVTARKVEATVRRYTEGEVLAAEAELLEQDALMDAVERQADFASKLDRAFTRCGTLERFFRDQGELCQRGLERQREVREVLERLKVEAELAGKRTG
jgi:hypothetical protein